MPSVAVAATSADVFAVQYIALFASLIATSGLPAVLFQQQSSNNKNTTKNFCSLFPTNKVFSGA